jgi:hypothetical protein
LFSYVKTRTERELMQEVINVHKTIPGCVVSRRSNVMKWTGNAISCKKFRDIVNPDKASDSYLLSAGYKINTNTFLILQD